MRYDVEASFVDPQPAAEVERLAAALPGVERAESWLTQTAYRLEGTAESRAVSMVAPPIPTSFVDPILMTGRWLQPGDSNAIVLGSNFASSNRDLVLGSDVILKMQGKPVAWRVVGIVKTRFLGLGTNDGPTVYVSRSGLERSLRTSGLTTSLRVATRDHSADAQAIVASQLHTELNRRGHPTLLVNTVSAIHDQREAPNELVLRFLVAMAALLATVGGLGLAGMITMSVLERTREIGVMRAVGASRVSIFSVITMEGVVIVLISCLLTIPLSVPVSYVLAAVTTDELFGEPVIFTFASSAIGLWAGVALLLAALATWLPAWRAVRVTVRSALSFE
jgi:putative ABC transport system permease protein